MTSLLKEIVLTSVKATKLPVQARTLFVDSETKRQKDEVTPHEWHEHHGIVVPPVKTLTAVYGLTNYMLGKVRTHKVRVKILDLPHTHRLTVWWEGSAFWLQIGAEPLGIFANLYEGSKNAASDHWRALRRTGSDLPAAPGMIVISRIPRGVLQVGYRMSALHGGLTPLSIDYDDSFTGIDREYKPRTGEKLLLLRDHVVQIVQERLSGESH